MSKYLENIGTPDSPITVRPIRSGRADWEVAQFRESAGLPAPFADTDIVNQLRVFFDKLEAEATERRDDPVAMVNALARMEALLADVRTATASIRKYAAEALSDYKVRRMTIDGLITVEGTSSSERTDWQHERLMTDMIKACFTDHLVEGETGQVHSAESVAKIILEWFRVEWRLTPIRAMGLDPDNYSDQPTDEDGKPLRIPTVRIYDNQLRKEQITR